MSELAKSCGQLLACERHRDDAPQHARWQPDEKNSTTCFGARVGTEVPPQECFESTGKKPVGVRWSGRVAQMSCQNPGEVWILWRCCVSACRQFNW